MMSTRFKANAHNVRGLADQASGGLGLRCDFSLKNARPRWFRTQTGNSPPAGKPPAEFPYMD